MKALVTGSSGHLGEALVRSLQAQNHEVVSIDIEASPFTTDVGSINDKELVQDCMQGVDSVFHSATLHKPHIITHCHQDFIDTNVSGTLTLLESAVASGVSSFIFTSTTSTFGDALRPSIVQPAAWITEDVLALSKNIYGASKLAAEDLCNLFHRNHGLNCIVLRTSRFFLEEDDDKQRRQAFSDDNLKVNEYLYRRVDIEDVVEAHFLAQLKAKEIGFAKYIISATTPFNPSQQHQLRSNLAGVLKTIHPEYAEVFYNKNWKMLAGIDRVYDNSAARKDLLWKPKYSFKYILECLKDNKPWQSELATAVGAKGYHSEVYYDGPYPV
jgi:nucleoside-diphosphate-sugar epimerase